MFFQTVLPYTNGQKAGVMIIGLAGLTSLTAILLLFIFKRPKRKTFQSTHMFGFIMSLLFANVLQSIGSIMVFRWVAIGAVTAGPLCNVQAGIKQAGNVGTSIWALIIAFHLFHILFLRNRASEKLFIATLIIAWAFVLFVILLGRYAIQSAERGPYYGISGSWCWITANYGPERVLLEYFFEFISVATSFTLYILVVLRVRGNLVKDEQHKWHLRFIGQGNDWALAITRDVVDNSMNKVAQKLVWFPVSYAIILVPISIARISSFDGTNVPFWATAFTDVIFNLTGFVNSILVIYIEKCFSTPETSFDPVFATRRQTFRHSFVKSGGIVPFTAQQSDSDEKDTPPVPPLPQRFVVDFPTRPQNTYVAPNSWGTTAPIGKVY